jgi:hypothetical protein
MAREADFITEVRALNKQIWDGIHGLKARQSEWNALDYSSTLDDGSGENEGITKAEVGAVLFDSTDAMVTLLGQGHATNLAKLL